MAQTSMSRIFQPSKIAIATFVKTPGVSPVKTRLASSIGQAKAEAFFLYSVEQTKKAIQDTKLPIHPFWAVGEKTCLNHPLWQDFPTLHTGEGELGQRIYHIYQQLLDTHTSVILLGADSPEITANLIEQAIHALQHPHDFVFGPAHDGGFYLFGGSAPLPKSIIDQVPYSQSNTMACFVDQLASKTIAYLPSLRDVDTEEDYQDWRRE